MQEQDPEDNPQNIGYETDLDLMYVETFKQVKTSDQFVSFLKKWDYWIDDSSKSLTADSWELVKKSMIDCRNKDFPGPFTKDHEVAMALLVPQKLLTVMKVAKYFGVPWGCAYIQLRKAKEINF